MTPIVNGLEQELTDRVAFVYVNAADGSEGQRAFEQLRLPGHPGYVIFNSDGDETYRTFGVVSAETLRAIIADHAL
jgi:hypothetical protein